MSKRKPITHQVLDARGLPDGLVVVCEEYGPAPSRKHNASWEYRAIDAAWKSGHIEMWKCARYPGDRNGVKYVFPADAERAFDTARNAQASRLSAKAAPSAASASQYEAAVIALCEINNGITLMQATLERLTAAVELIATQPKTPQQELVSTFERNGFHQ
jgi:hypothetical protein